MIDNILMIGMGIVFFIWLLVKGFEKDLDDSLDEDEDLWNK